MGGAVGFLCEAWGLWRRARWGWVHEGRARGGLVFMNHFRHFRHFRDT